MTASRLRGVLVATVAALTLAGCFTGDRPSFEPQSIPTETGNASIDEVLGRLDSVAGSQFTADYEIYAASGESVTATVVQADAGRRSITVDDVRYLIEAGDGITCDLTAGECDGSLNDARISNLQLTHEFYGPAFATRLRVDADRRVADPTGYTETVDGEEAACVLVPVNGGEKTYCATESGLLSRYLGPDAEVRLVAIDPVPDETQFTTS